MTLRIGTNNEPNRRAWLERVLKGVPAGSRILDAGAGECQYASLCSHLDYVSQDFARYDGTGDRRALQTDSWSESGIDIVSDITDIPVPDASFDAVMCTEVFEHLPRPDLALHEFTRILRPGGLLIITAPFSSLTHFSPYYYYTGFSENFYRYWLDRLGYTILEIDSNGNFFEFLGQEMRRIPFVVDNYVPSRPALTAHENALIHAVMEVFETLGKQDRGSAELVCHGLHVLAEKNGGS